MRANIQLNQTTTRHELVDTNNKLIKSYVSKQDILNYAKMNDIEILDEVIYTETKIHIPTFKINTRFDFVTKLSNMVIHGKVNSFVLTGGPGLGKSYNLIQELTKLNRVEDEDYIFVKGASTARGLFQIIKNNPSKLIIFDDCDDVLKDPKATNILKAVLEQGARARMVSWSTSDGIDVVSFTGQIIFISNLPKGRLPAPIISRSFFVDLHMTNEEVIERLRFILPNMNDVVLTLDEKIECLDLLNEYKEVTSDLNARTLNKLFSIRAIGIGWKELATYTLMA
jgi:uncharacterized protein YktA (UPF0223 family)